MQQACIAFKEDTGDSSSFNVGNVGRKVANARITEEFNVKTYTKRNFSREW